LPASVAVWRSVRAHGDTKTAKSRRTLALPRMAAVALRALKDQQAADRREVGHQWNEQDLVFATRSGVALDAANVRASIAVLGEGGSAPYARAWHGHAVEGLP
jgi:hypothetical protein